MLPYSPAIYVFAALAFASVATASEIRLVDRFQPSANRITVTRAFGKPVEVSRPTQQPFKFNKAPLLESSRPASSLPVTRRPVTRLPKVGRVKSAGNSTILRTTRRVISPRSTLFRAR